MRDAQILGRAQALLMFNAPLVESSVTRMGCQRVQMLTPNMPPKARISRASAGIDAQSAVETARDCGLSLLKGLRARFAAHVATAICSLLLATAAPPLAALAETSGSPVAMEVWSLIDRYYLDRTFNGVDWAATKAAVESKAPLTDGAAMSLAEDLVRSLGDRYSRVLKPELAAKLSKYDVTGVGINLAIADSGKMMINAVPPDGSDASAAGIKFGDEILSINGLSTSGMTSFDALEAIQLNKETVSLRIRPAAGGDARDVLLRRAYVARDPVRSRVVVGADGRKTGYIKLSEFSAEVKPRMREALAELQAAGASRLVLDLRGNGGGVLDGAIGIAGLFADHPLVLYVTDANGGRQPLYSREDPVEKRPLEVWVDASTASSAEVLASALHDNCRAKLVGAKTFGKGVIQGVFGLSNGGALVETVASYATPAGNEINKLGVAPDEPRFFASDVLGSAFVNADVKAAKFEPLTCSAERMPPRDKAGASPRAFPTVK